jgi:hypothetical protein
MLPDQATQLLTAFVDRELSQRQRKAVMRLLHKSSEAREMLRQLQENAHKLKQLPRRKIEPSLVDEILRAIAEQQPQPKQPAVKAARRRWLPYVAASMAAALLIGALGIVYWKAMEEPNGVPKHAPNVAEGKTPDRKLAPPSPKPRPLNPMVTQMVEKTFVEFSKQPPVDPALTGNINELQEGPKSWQFAREVNREKAIQLDFTVKSNSNAMDRLKVVLGDRGIRLVTDNSAAKTHDDKKVQYLVYADDLTSEEVIKITDALGRSFVTSGQKNGSRTSPSPYQKVTVTPTAKEEKEKLDKLLGAPTEGKPVPKKERKAVVLPVSPGAMASSEVLEVGKQRRVPQAGTLQVLIRIHLE